MIKIFERWFHSKASEEFVSVEFIYPDDNIRNWSIPVKYPRSGLELDDENEINSYIEEIYKIAHPQNIVQWRLDQDEYWKNSKAPITKPIFDALAENFEWLTYNEMSSSSNPARRIQDLKQMGYTIATRRKKGVGYQFMLLPIPRHGQTGYEWWSGSLRARIVRVLKTLDAYEGRKGNAKALLPDHKFPEARWDETTRRETLEHLTDDDIRRDFQLITNQRNQQKREVCRKCLQTGKRGYPFEIKYYYKGTEDWPETVPKRGKSAEAGCEGCGWYDLDICRTSVTDRLSD